MTASKRTSKTAGADSRLGTSQPAAPETPRIEISEPDGLRIDPKPDASGSLLDGRANAAAPSSPVETLNDLTPDPTNRRSHPTRNVSMITEALRDVGAARSIVIDERGEVLAGNGVLEAAREAGLSKVRVVDVDGDTLVAVRRTGLDAEQKRRLAMFDNRSGDLAEWNLEQLRADIENGLDLAPFFADAELQDLLTDASVRTVSFQAADENTPTEHRCPKCGYEWSGSSAPRTATGRPVNENENE